MWDREPEWPADRRTPFPVRGRNSTLYDWRDATRLGRRGKVLLLLGITFVFSIPALVMWPTLLTASLSMEPATVTHVMAPEGELGSPGLRAAVDTRCRARRLALVTESGREVTGLTCALQLPPGATTEVAAFRSDPSQVVIDPSHGLHLALLAGGVLLAQAAYLGLLWVLKREGGLHHRRMDRGFVLMLVVVAALLAHHGYRTAAGAPWPVADPDRTNAQQAERAVTQALERELGPVVAAGTEVTCADFPRHELGETTRCRLEGPADVSSAVVEAQPYEEARFRVRLG